MSSIRVLIVPSLVYNLVMYQSDFKIALSNRELERKFILINLKTVVPREEQKVYRLVKPLYELKQEPKQEPKQ